MFRRSFVRGSSTLSPKDYSGRRAKFGPKETSKTRFPKQEKKPLRHYSEPCPTNPPHPMLRHICRINILASELLPGSMNHRLGVFVLCCRPQPTHVPYGRLYAKRNQIIWISSCREGRHDKRNIMKHKNSVVWSPGLPEG